MKRRSAAIGWIGAFLAIAAAVAVWYGMYGRPSAADMPCCYAAVTDQGTHRIIVLDTDAADWNDERAVRWAWSPNDVPGFEKLKHAWGLPTDAKPRYDGESGAVRVAVTDSRGLAAIVSYPDGGKVWAADAGGNPHSAELLPNGNIAVAASTGGWVRVYASSQGDTVTTYAEYGLASAHGVQWDPKLGVLWALGGDSLVALKVSGTDAAPELAEVRKVALPTKHGHDLQPVYGDADRLWVTTGSKVYQFVKSANAFDDAFPGHEAISRVGVKGIGSFASGLVVETVPDVAKSPAGVCKRNTWCTETVDLFRPDGTRTIEGGAIYKVRVWNADYQ
ncbi:DUF6528 family protein [Paenibacillus flagellatus]|uniref:WD40 repeat domain-containing protein n=1 Tax=Paenibacillus flagellatus TaxID=2211139 RepID=A0A2V5KFC2_9BACL|nr:DUF6528 family protein [Paenibacillus flagellatus]PYI57104.1 hypothetical protein DLM86_01270 [Paenibacillus flagellatus]